MNGKVFILEDDASICVLVKVAFEMNGLECKAFSTLQSFAAAFDKTDDIVVVKMNGKRLRDAFKTIRLNLQILVIKNCARLFFHIAIMP